MFEEILKDISNKTKNLTKKPPKLKRKDYGKIQAFKKGVSQQADLLMLPEDDEGYKYLLTIIDVYDKTADAEPLKSKKPEEVLKAFKKIYSRKYLDRPKTLISLDGGTEFKGVVKNYFKNHKVRIKYTKPGRHSQQGVIEGFNSIMSKAIMTLLLDKELETNKKNTEWRQYVRKIISSYNKLKKLPKKKEDKPPHCRGISCELLERGTKVRYKLDNPKDFKGKKLHGNFRHGDVRWSDRIHKIEKFFLVPNNPPLYKLNDISNVLYKRQELQVI